MTETSAFAAAASDIEAILELSNEVLKAAQEDRWDDVVVMEARCAEEIRAFFEIPHHTELEQEKLAAAIRQLQAIGNEVRALAELKQQALAEAMHQINLGRRATSAYDGSRGG